MSSYSKKQIILSLLVVSLILLTSTSCTKVSEFLSGGEQESTLTIEAPAEVKKSISVNGARVKRGEISSFIEVAGLVTTSNPVALIGEATGTLKNFSVEVGDKVTEEQVVAQIDPSRPGMNYKMKDVKAPISGTIISVQTKEGALVSPSTPLAYIQDLSDLTIKANIIEKYISSVTIGQPVEIMFDAFPHETFKGTVSSLDPTVNTQTRSLGIEIEYDDLENQVLPGMYAKNKIIIKTIDDALLIPSTAVFAKDNSFYVYVIENDRLSKTSITKGLETYDFVQVIEGLQEGDIIVNTKSSLLGEGSYVSILNEGDL